jgi:hypothetical protein
LEKLHLLSPSACDGTKAAWGEMDTAALPHCRLPPLQLRDPTGVFVSHVHGPAARAAARPAMLPSVTMNPRRPMRIAM